MTPQNIFFFFFAKIHLKCVKRVLCPNIYLYLNEAEKQVLQKYLNVENVKVAHLHQLIVQTFFPVSEVAHYFPSVILQQPPSCSCVLCL